jgi:hypothetical protein
MHPHSRGLASTKTNTIQIEQIFEATIMILSHKWRSRRSMAGDTGKAKTTPSPSAAERKDKTKARAAIKEA